MLAVSLLTLLVFSHGDKAGSETDGLMGEFRLMLLRVAVVYRGKGALSEHRVETETRRPLDVPTDKVSGLLVVVKSEHCE